MASHFDSVNQPEHYAASTIECIEAIEAQLSPEEYKGFLKGNVAKYVWRESRKQGIESLKKARWYLDRLIALEESKVTPADSEVRLDQKCLGTSFYERAKQTAIPDS